MTMSNAGDREFLPMTPGEMERRGWSELDVLLISGDAYVDHPSFGVAVIGRVLEAAGYRTGIIAQPDWRTAESFLALGRPRLFCGITSGNLDSMLAHYTAARHRRHEDDYSPGGEMGLRPNRAATVYAQRIRETFPGLPVVLGGIEASMRRSVHYDYWADQIRPSLLLDSKADLIIYGMGEAAVTEVARRLASGADDLDGIPGTARLLGGRASAEVKEESGTLFLPSLEKCRNDGTTLLDCTRMVEREQNPLCGKRLVQFHGDRALIMEPPSLPLSSVELDRIYELPFMRKPHFSYTLPIPAWEMVRDSITVLRGCPGGCTFCSLGFHQGRFISSRSHDSLMRELRSLAESKEFRGTVSDLGGPTANLYGCINGRTEACKQCRRGSCLYPSICINLELREKPALRLYREARLMEGINHVFISSGIRMDVALHMPGYARELVRHHVPGHLKVAPEHLHDDVLRRMRKPPSDVFYRFQELFTMESQKINKEQYIVPYFISSFPGCGEGEMKVVEEFLRKTHWKLQQVQDFIPLPMTPASAMYYTGLDYETGKAIVVTRGLKARKRQKGHLQPVRKAKEGSSVRKVKEGASVRKAEEGASVRKVKEGASVRKMREGASVRKVREGASVRKAKEGSSVRKDERRGKRSRH
jgi:uncharacterized radical SAM protein YgiQ